MFTTETDPKDSPYRSGSPAPKRHTADRRGFDLFSQREGRQEGEEEPLVTLKCRPYVTDCARRLPRRSRPARRGARYAPGARLLVADSVRAGSARPEQPSTVEDLGAQIKSEVEWVAEVDLRFVPSRDYLYR